MAKKASSFLGFGLVVVAACGGSNADSPPPSTAPAPVATTPAPTSNVYRVPVYQVPPRSAPAPTYTPQKSDDGKVGAGEMAHAMLRERSGAFRECYEQGLLGKPSLAGQITIKFLLTPAGQATSLSKEASSLSDETVEQCVIKTVMGINFARFEGKAVTIVYPIEFKPAGAGATPAKLEGRPNVFSRWPWECGPAA